MKAVTKTYKVYQFAELPEKIKKEVISKWYENVGEDYSFLSEDLTEQTTLLLQENGIEFSNLKLYYSLSYSQGDGLCFTGNLIYKGINYRITHNYRYYFASSVTVEKTDPETEEQESVSFKNPDEFMQLYLKIAKEVERQGYSILDYRMDNEEFSEHCEANNYAFLINGEMFNE
jgi:hypothetical protein